MKIDGRLRKGERDEQDGRGKKRRQEINERRG